MNEGRFIRLCRRVERALLAAGITSRAQLVSGYDSRSHFEDVKGIGKVLGKVLRQALDDYGNLEWQVVFPNIPFEEGDV